METVKEALEMPAGKVRKAIIESLSVFMFSLVLALAGNALSPKGIHLTGGQWNPAQGIMHAGDRCAPTTQDMDITSLLFLMEQQPESILVIDARSAGEFKDGHIPGALSLPLKDVFDDLPAFRNQHNTQKVIIVYCSGTECWDAQELADILKSVDCPRVFVCGQGFQGWVSGNRPVEKGRP